MSRLYQSKTLAHFYKISYYKEVEIFLSSSYFDPAKVSYYINWNNFDLFLNPVANDVNILEINCASSSLFSRYTLFFLRILLEYLRLRWIQVYYRIIDSSEFIIADHLNVFQSIFIPLKGIFFRTINSYST